MTIVAAAVLLFILVMIAGCRWCPRAAVLVQYFAAETTGHERAAPVESGRDVTFPHFNGQGLLAAQRAGAAPEAMSDAACAPIPVLVGRGSMSATSVEGGHAIVRENYAHYKLERACIALSMTQGAQPAEDEVSSPGALILSVAHSLKRDREALLRLLLVDPMFVEIGDATDGSRLTTALAMPGGHIGLSSADGPSGTLRSGQLRLIRCDPINSGQAFDYRLAGIESDANPPSRERALARSSQAIVRAYFQGDLGAATMDSVGRRRAPTAKESAASRMSLYDPAYASMHSDRQSAAYQFDNLWFIAHANRLPHVFSIQCALRMPSMAPDEARVILKVSAQPSPGQRSYEYEYCWAREFGAGGPNNVVTIAATSSADGYATITAFNAKLDGTCGTDSDSVSIRVPATNTVISLSVTASPTETTLYARWQGGFSLARYRLGGELASAAQHNLFARLFMGGSDEGGDDIQSRKLGAITMTWSPDAVLGVQAVTHGRINMLK